MVASVVATVKKIVAVIEVILTPDKTAVCLARSIKHLCDRC